MQKGSKCSSIVPAAREKFRAATVIGQRGGPPSRDGENSRHRACRFRYRRRGVFQDAASRRTGGTRPPKGELHSRSPHHTRKRLRPPDLGESSLERPPKALRQPLFRQRSPDPSSHFGDQAPRPGTLHPKKWRRFSGMTLATLRSTHRSPPHRASGPGSVRRHERRPQRKNRNRRDS